MPPVVTVAIVLHAQDYNESSRILRLATRDAGVQSVLARGARVSKRRFGPAVDLFAEGEVQYDLRAGRDLHTLARFDVVRARTALASSLDRFEGASALVDVMLRVANDDGTPADTFDALRDGLDAIAADGDAVSATVRATWRLLASIGFTPALDSCVACDRDLDASLDVAFSAESGGVLCATCGARTPSRRLPASARAQLRRWLSGDPMVDAASALPIHAPTTRAHRRLLRMFVHAHLTDGRPLRAFDAWATADASV